MSFSDHEPPGHSGKTNTWLTPKYIIDALGPFDLDPCAAPLPRPWNTAKEMITEEQDGLVVPWNNQTDSYVWLNPPYGRNIFEWVQKMVSHRNGIMLTFARTDTKWFQYAASNSTLMLFLSGRIRFCTPDGKQGTGNAGAPSCLIAFGNFASKKLEKSGLSGIFVKNINKY